MTRWVIASLALLCQPVLARPQQGVHKIPFDSTPNVLQLPKDLYLGEVAGVAVNSKGHIFVFHRGNSNGPAYAAAAAQLLEFDKDGKFVREIGKNLYAWSFAHTVRVAKVDKKGTFLRAFSIDVPFDHSIRPVIGKADPNATSGTFAPGAPWAICITPGPDQVLYASDAYPGRVYKLSLDGKVLGVLGGPGRQLKQFAWIHEIACPSENVLYVAELLTWRVQKLLLHPARTSANASAPGGR